MKYPVPVVETANIALGNFVEDVITGFCGLVTAKQFYFYSTPRVFVEPMVIKDEKPVEGVWFEERRVIQCENKRPEPGFCNRPLLPRDPKEVY